MLHMLNYIFYREADDKIRGSMERMISIWKERGVFDDELIEKLRQAMGKLIGVLSWVGQSGF